MEQIHLTPHSFHGDWNYDSRARPQIDHSVII